MKLLNLNSCAIYRDGGSLEAIWQTDQDTQWAVTLLIGPWDMPSDPRAYFLFNCRIYQIIPHRRIDRGTAEYKQVCSLIETWLQETGSSPDDIPDPHNRLAEFLTILRDEIR